MYLHKSKIYLKKSIAMLINAKRTLKFEQQRWMNARKECKSMNSLS